MELGKIKLAWEMPAEPQQIVIFGAGSIVKDAHLPAYKKYGLPVAGIYAPNYSNAECLAASFGTKAFRTLEEACAVDNAIFDLATPPAAHASILNKLSKGSAVLIQKPFGSDLEGATALLQLCQDRDLIGAVNFQLRFSPMALAIKNIIESGVIGEVLDLSVIGVVNTPWEMFPFLEGLPRIEILMHSIHYIDLMRSILGEPQYVKATTIGNLGEGPAQTRTSAIFDYGPNIRSTLSITHDHKFGNKFQLCEIRIDGSKGAARLKLGTILNYPIGEADEFWIYEKCKGEWLEVPLVGSWFPDAFAFRMANLQRFKSGEDDVLHGDVSDAWKTMAIVEAAYASSAAHGTPIPQLT